MTQGKHFAAGGDHFAALPNKKFHAPKGIARLTVTAATMAAMTGSSLISPFTAFAQTGDGGTQHPAVMSPIAAHADAASGTGAKSAAQTIADLQKAVNEAKARFYRALSYLLDFLFASDALNMGVRAELEIDAVGIFNSLLRHIVADELGELTADPVSYTHLTLPTT